MVKAVRASSEELKAFFRACEKNGIEISNKPKKAHEATPIIVNKNGYRFSISDAAEKRATGGLGGTAKQGVCRRRADAHDQRESIPYNKRKGTV